MIQVRLKNPTLIITPISQEEVEKGFGFASVYALYRNGQGDIEIGIPDMLEYFPSTANMFGFGEATEKAFFYNGGAKLVEAASDIQDRPVYSIYPSDDRKVEECNILNGVNVTLSEVLSGQFQVQSDRKPRSM